MARSEPDRLFTENLKLIAKIADDSRYCDSRVERWCHHTGQSVELSRAALASGYTVRFHADRRGHRILLHMIRPGEVQ